MSICNALQKKDTRHRRWKRFLQMHPGFRELICGRDVHQELQRRTRGLDVTIRGWPPDTTSIWDFGGQQEYYVLHDYLFPNAGNSCFLYICSALHPPDRRSGHRAIKVQQDIEKEFRFWMRFIASNFKHLRAEDGRLHRPSIRFVLTHLDTIEPKDKIHVKGLAQHIVADFRTPEHFGGFLDISDEVEAIDSHDPKAVEVLFEKSRSILKTILDETLVYEVCSEVFDALQKELLLRPSTRILDLKKVTEICSSGHLVRQLHKLFGRASTDQKQWFRAGLNIVLKYLNDVGDIIFLEGLDFIIVDVAWFGREVLGRLIDQFTPSHAPHGVELSKETDLRVPCGHHPQFSSTALLNVSVSCPVEYKYAKRPSGDHIACVG